MRKSDAAPVAGHEQAAQHVADGWQQEQRADDVGDEAGEDQQPARHEEQHAVEEAGRGYPPGVGLPLGSAEHGQALLLDQPHTDEDEA